MAVLIVVLYHAKVPGFSGGFVGVDLFFVLSGYLITGLLVAEAEKTGAIDLARFFSRRIRRLLPAQTVMLVGTGAAVLALYSPPEQFGFATTALWTALYASNVYFGFEATDYHAADAATNPFLHTWSLAVEEQFYLAWPVLVIFALGVGTSWALSKRRLALAMTVVIGLTLWFSDYLIGAFNLHWAFFSSQARAWEFAVGGLAVLLPHHEVQASIRPWIVGLGSAGLVAVLWCSWAYSEATVFPGFGALPPVLGTTAVLIAGRSAAGSPLTRLLAIRPLRELGRLSYSWYLWHWPVLIIADGLFAPLSLSARLSLAAGSLVLAEASYRLVENPVRHHTALVGYPVRGLFLLVVLTTISAGAAIGWSAIVEVQSASPSMARFTEARADDPYARLEAAGCISRGMTFDYAECTMGPADADTVLFLFGDSHAADLHAPLHAIAQRRGWRLDTSIKLACPPWFAPPYITTLKSHNQRCSAWHQRILARTDSLQPDIIAVKGWHVYNLSPSDWETAADSLYRALTPRANLVLDFRDLPTPTSFEPAICLARSSWNGNTRDCSVPLVNTIPWTDRSKAARAYPNVQLIDFTAEVCPDGACPAETGGRIVYRDHQHLTRTFALSLDSLLDARIQKTVRMRPDSSHGNSP